VLPVTPDGTPTAIGLSALTPLRLPASSGEPQATTAVRFVASLPADALPPVPAFDRANPASYTAATSERVFDANGNARTLTLFYRRIESPPGDSTRIFEVRSFLGDNEILPDGGTDPLQLVFDADGVLITPPGPVAFAPGFSISHADSSVASGPFNISFSEQDGRAPGRLEGIGVDLAGVVRASFSNGETIAIGQLAIGNVPNPQGLRQNGNVSWTLAPTSGPIQIGTAGRDGLGAVTAGSIERSNVDLTEELVGLISAQRNFQANARAIDTASTLLQTIIQLRN
jgi:flagellar hook protein FlgE